MKLELPFVGVFLILHGRLRFVIRETIRLRRDHTWPLERIVPNAKRSVLLLGDSTAVGTGASHPEQSLAGLFAAEDLRTSISVVAKNGLFIADLPKLMTSIAGQRFDLVVILIGGNDVLQFTSQRQMRQALLRIVAQAKQLSNRIILVHQGDLGAMPLFPRWFAARLTARSRAWRETMLEVARAEQVAMVDLFHETADDPWARDPERFYSGDWFHPNDAGYATWYERIQHVLRQRGWEG